MLNNVLDFLKENWRLILEVCLVITSAVIFAIRKKPVKVVDTLREIILRLLPGCINSVEINCSGVKGDTKKNLCIQLVLETLKGLGYVEVSQDYLDFISEQIEVILSTPQKKGL